MAMSEEEDISGFATQAEGPIYMYKYNDNKTSHNFIGFQLTQSLRWRSNWSGWHASSQEGMVIAGDGPGMEAMKTKSTITWLLTNTRRMEIKVLHLFAALHLTDNIYEGSVNGAFMLKIKGVSNFWCPMFYIKIKACNLEERKCEST